MTTQQLEEKCRDIRKDVICMIFESQSGKSEEMLEEYGLIASHLT